LRLCDRGLLMVVCRRCANGAATPSSPGAGGRDP
jgi:hypothetical protein